MDQMSAVLQARIDKKKEINSLKNNNVQYANLSAKPDTFESSNKKDNKGKVAKIIAIGAAIAAATAGIIYALKKGKSINLDTMTSEKFKQIQADKYTGKIKGKLKNGDKIVMEYVDGVLQKSTRSGKINIEKVYETGNIGKIVSVTKTVDGVTTKVNVQENKLNVLESNAGLSDENMIRLLGGNTGLIKTISHYKAENNDEFYRVSIIHKAKLLEEETKKLDSIVSQISDIEKNSPGSVQQSIAASYLSSRERAKAQEAIDFAKTLPQDLPQQVG